MQSTTFHNIMNELLLLHRNFTHNIATFVLSFCPTFTATSSFAPFKRASPHIICMICFFLLFLNRLYVCISLNFTGDQLTILLPTLVLSMLLQDLNRNACPDVGADWIKRPIIQPFESFVTVVIIIFCNSHFTWIVLTYQTVKNTSMRYI